MIQTENKEGVADPDNSKPEEAKQSAGENQDPILPTTSTNESKPKLLTRTGSDSRFDNLEYLMKIESQTIAMLKSQGLDINESELHK